MKMGNGVVGIGVGMVVVSIALNAALLAGAVWLVVKVLQWTGVL